MNHSSKRFEIILNLLSLIDSMWKKDYETRTLDWKDLPLDVKKFFLQTILEIEHELNLLKLSCKDS